MSFDPVAALLQSPYASWLGVLLAFLLVLLLIRAAGSGFRRTWNPLSKIVNGRVKKRRGTITLNGSYCGHPVIASLSPDGETSPLFSVQIPVGSRGRDWEISHRSEKLLGPETWRPYTRDPALQRQLEVANVGAWLRDWPKQMVIRYGAEQGTLTVSEPGRAPSPQHFRAQLQLLETFAELNRDVNGI